MKIDEKILYRINELIELGNRILNSAEVINHTYSGRMNFATQRSAPPKTTQEFKVDSLQAIQWKTNCQHILLKVFNENIHLNNFNEATRATNFNGVKLGIGVLNAAKDDYESGYLFDTRALIEAEVFDDFLEQSEHLLNQGYFTAAAVIAGSVLEDGLRKLCAKNSITLSAKPKLDTMNADLAKIGVYNLLKQKQITALADLRNKAAHGQGGFVKEDVEAMIKDVRRFMEDYFG